MILQAAIDEDHAAECSCESFLFLWAVVVILQWNRSEENDYIKKNLLGP